MFNFLKQKFDAWQWQRSALGQALALHSQQYFYGEMGLASFQESAKVALINKLYDDVSAVQASPNGFMDLRHLLADVVTTFAQVQAVTLTEAEKNGVPDYRDNPYISGQLHHSLKAFVHLIPDLARNQAEIEALNEVEALSVCNGRGAILSYFMNGYNMLRIVRGDKTENDWFLPFVEAMIVGEEDAIREATGMPRFLANAPDGAHYSEFQMIVKQGDVDPLQTWMTKFPGLYLSRTANLKT